MRGRNKTDQRPMKYPLSEALWSFYRVPGITRRQDNQEVLDKTDKVSIPDNHMGPDGRLLQAVLHA